MSAIIIWVFIYIRSYNFKLCPLAKEKRKNLNKTLMVRHKLEKKPNIRISLEFSSKEKKPHWNW